MYIATIVTDNRIKIKHINFSIKKALPSHDIQLKNITDIQRNTAQALKQIAVIKVSGNFIVNYPNKFP